MARAARRYRQGAVVLCAWAGLLQTAAVRAQPGAGAGQATPSDRVAPQPASMVHVRGIRDAIYDGSRLLANSTEASPTVRRLLEVLEQSDVVVFVEVRDRLSNGRAQLTFVGYRGGVRWLRVAIDAGQQARQQVAFLAHELQHAVEVAHAPEVKDLDGFRRLYSRIGIPLDAGHFETEAAVAAENQALREAYAGKRRRP